MDDRITTPVQAHLDAYLAARFPEVTAPIERRWAGIMGFTPDGMPLVGTLPDMPDVAFAVGFNGHGLAMGAGTAERAVEMIPKRNRASGLLEFEKCERCQSALHDFFGDAGLR